MKITIGNLRSLIAEALVVEFGTPRGALRKPGSGGRQYKIGKVEDENRELSYAEVEATFPGATDAWIEIVTLGDDLPELKDLSPRQIILRSLWFKIGDELRVAIEPFPQIELMRWDPQAQDWFDLDRAA